MGLVWWIECATRRAHGLAAGPASGKTTPHKLGVTGIAGTI
jgi:hypothetical protein